MLAFLKPAFSLSSFNFIKRLFSSFQFSDIRVVSSAYLRNIDISPGNLDSSLSSSSRAFCMMYSAYKLGILRQAQLVRHSLKHSSTRKRCRLDPRVRIKIPQRRARQPTPVFLPGERGKRMAREASQEVHSVTKSKNWLKQLSTHTC